MENEILSRAVAFASCTGLSMGLKNSQGEERFTHAPFSLYPCPFPKSSFERAVSLAKACNLLVDKVARDPVFLKETLRGVVSSGADEFTARLVSLYEKMENCKFNQSLYLGLHRSDYMVDEPTGRLLQVELNTIASSFGCLSKLVGDLHRTLSGRHPDALGNADLPENKSTEGLSDGLGLAALHYKDLMKTESKVHVLFVVQPGESNWFCQRLLEAAIWARHKVPVIRRTLAEIQARGRVDPNTGSLFVDDFEVGVVYFRAGYTPRDYPTEKEWEGRHLMEASMAIKCPSISYHLAGTKKVQQKLAEPGVLEKFLPESDAKNMRQSFAGLWSMDETVQVEVLKDAIANPDGYVLKPQREGGGNNMYGKDVSDALKRMSEKERSAYILMERIRPATTSAKLVRNGVINETMNCVSELGIYSVFLGNGKDAPVFNYDSGHLVRTKSNDVDEGGVAAGYAYLDSPNLITK